MKVKVKHLNIFQCLAGRTAMVSHRCMNLPARAWKFTQNKLLNMGWPSLNIFKIMDICCQKVLSLYVHIGNGWVAGFCCTAACSGFYLFVYLFAYWERVCLRTAVLFLQLLLRGRRRRLFFYCTVAFFFFFFLSSKSGKYNFIIFSFYFFFFRILSRSLRLLFSVQWTFPLSAASLSVRAAAWQLSIRTFSDPPSRGGLCPSLTPSFWPLPRFEACLPWPFSLNFW